MKHILNKPPCQRKFAEFLNIDVVTTKRFESSVVVSSGVPQVMQGEGHVLKQGSVICIRKIKFLFWAALLLSILLLSVTQTLRLNPLTNSRLGTKRV